jgi:hypothetical protein
LFDGAGDLVDPNGDHTKIAKRGLGWLREFEKNHADALVKRLPFHEVVKSPKGAVACAAMQDALSRVRLAINHDDYEAVDLVEAEQSCVVALTHQRGNLLLFEADALLALGKDNFESLGLQCD